MMSIPEADKNNLNIFNTDAAFIKTMKQTYTQFQANPNAHKSHIKYYTLPRPKTDVPVVVKSKSEMYSEMRKAVREMSGTNFVLGMLDDDGQIKVWRRPDQPCQGGELRKYGCTHDDCTRPSDPRPTDLRYPFPDGKPLAYGVKPRYGMKSERLPITFHNDSPYARAFGFTENVEIIMHNENKSLPQGFIVKDADYLEPTVLINMIRTLNKSADLNTLDLINHGYTVPEIFIMLEFSHNGLSWGMSNDNKENTNYYDLERFMKGGIEASYNLSGGVLGNRFDYNRPDLTDIFKDKIGKNIYLGDVAKSFLKKKQLAYSSLGKTGLISILPDIRGAIAEVIEAKKKVA